MGNIILLIDRLTLERKVPGKGESLFLSDDKTRLYLSTKHLRHAFLYFSNNPKYLVTFFLTKRKIRVLEDVSVKLTIER